MPDYFRAVAVDFDGTLTSCGRPAEMVLRAVRQARQAGRRVVLVSGRILAELRDAFPDVDQWFDAIVAENGAVIAGTRGRRQLATPVDCRIRRALEHRGHQVRAGLVLLACRAEADVDALAAINRFGLGYQLVYNRAELMILPADVTKGTGLVEALADLGLYPHSTVGVGDAENDHALLERCELGVAVANAVEALKDRADIVLDLLDLLDGEGVAAFLAGPVLRGEQRVHPRRWHLELGTTTDGEPVTVPASQVDVLITGASRSGRSFLTGLLAERLIDLGYCVVLVDPEGDHTRLGQIPGVIVVGGSEAPPDVDHLTQLIGPGRGSVVVDLSQLPAAAEHAYYRDASPRLSQLRARNGLPHRLIFDEAHEPLPDAGLARHAYMPSRKGHCLVTHRPVVLCREASDDLDVPIVMLPGSVRRRADDEPDPVLESLAVFTSLSRAGLATRLADPADLGGANAVLVCRDAPHDLVPFTPGGRRTSHVRHWHTYSDGALDWHRRFFFHRGPHRPTGAVAANLVSFHHELGRCEPSVVLHHLRLGDFSRWIAGVLRDDILADQFRHIENAHRAGDDPADARAELLAALEERYLG